MEAGRSKTQVRRGGAQRSISDGMWHGNRQRNPSKYDILGHRPLHIYINPLKHSGCHGRLTTGRYLVAVCIVYKRMTAWSGMVFFCFRLLCFADVHSYSLYRRKVQMKSTPLVQTHF